MPKLSLVVCLYQERDLLERLLRETNGLFDDLVVVHDGSEVGANQDASGLAEPDQPPAIDYHELIGSSLLPNRYHLADNPPGPDSIAALVGHYGGRYFEGPRCFQQEPHWPFAWSQAHHDWILRLDADEFPSETLKEWLRQFRQVEEVAPDISAYTCIWPLWNGRKEVTSRWPAGRGFLFHRGRVRFFGMAEQVPIPDGRQEPLNFALRHQPARKSYGLANILLRKQGFFWRRVISDSLLRYPQDLARWRWNHEGWPPLWRRLRDDPIRGGFYFFFHGFASTLRDQWAADRSVMPLMAIATPLHHLLIGFQLARKRNPR